MIYLVEIDKGDSGDTHGLYIPEYRLVEAVSENMAIILLKKDPFITAHDKFIFHPIIKQ